MRMGVVVLCFLFLELSLERSGPSTVIGCVVLGSIRFLQGVVAASALRSGVERMAFFFNVHWDLKLVPEVLVCNLD